jgi:hypothetical protein
VKLFISLASYVILAGTNLKEEGVTVEGQQLFFIDFLLWGRQ